MARASTPTLLSLDRWAKIMNLNPVHFSGAAGSTVWSDTGGACKDVWPQHSWQSPDIISREELARSIKVAEDSIMRALGYSPAPRWFAEEEHRYPIYHNLGWRHAAPQPGNMRVNYRHVIAGGRRAVTLLDDAVTITYSDNDSDGFYETASISISGVTVTDVREIKLFFAGHEGRAEWEIRPLRTRSLSAGIYTATFDSWLAINPNLWEKFPTSIELTAIDVTTTSNFVTTLDVYRVYNSVEEAPSLFSNGSGYYCSNCGNTGCESCTQTGCLRVIDGEAGKVFVESAEYDDESASWLAYPCYRSFDADTVKFWYYAGYRSQEYKAGYDDDPLDDMLAQAITMLATARLTKPVCSCSNVRLMADDLRRDFAFGDRTSFNLIWRNSTVQTNPFGSKAGEVRAWKIVNELIGDAVIGGAM